MNRFIPSDRVEAGGVDIAQIGATSVLIKIDELADQQAWRHPIWSLSRGLGRLGMRSLQVHGATEYLDSLAEVMRDARFTQVIGPWFAELVDPMVDDVDLVVDLTNSVQSKRLSAALASARSIPFLSVGWGKTSVKLMCPTDPFTEVRESRRTRAFPGLPLLPVARIASGMALQEILIAVGGCALASAPDLTVCYNTADETRTGTRGVDWPEIELENVTVDVVGAGGTGVHFLEAFAPLLSGSCELRIFDPDVVGHENLTMQIAYSADDAGESKAVVMANNLSQTCRAKVRAFAIDYQARPATLATSALRVLCPDNYAARALANESSLQDGVPLVDVGSSPWAGRVSAYYPGKTACLEHHLPGLMEKAADERQHASCWQDHEPTLPGTNMVCGGIAACEAVRAIRPDLFGWPSRGTILYDTRFSRRFGVVDPRPPCRHGVPLERARTALSADSPASVEGSK